MRRREFLRSTALALAALGMGRTARPALAAPAVISRTKDLVVTSPWPQSASGYSDLAFGFTRRLEQAFGGRIRCHMETGPASSIDALNSGGADLHIGFEHGNVPHHAAFGYFAGLPGEMGLNAVTFGDWLEAGGGQELWNDCSAPFCIKSLMLAHTATSGGLWSKAGFPALSGKRIAAQGIACDVLKGLGAEVTSIDMNAAGTAIANGSIDAVEMSHVVEALEAGVAQAANFAIVPGLTRGGNTLAVSLKRGLWDALGAEAQALVMGVAADTCRRTTADLRANDQALREVFGTANGFAFVSPGPVLATEITRVAEAVVADIAARDARSRRINSAYMAFRNDQGTA